MKYAFQGGKSSGQGSKSAWQSKKNGTHDKLPSKRISSPSKFLLLLALINFAAALYALQYYAPQLSRTQPLLWLFVIDCPFYAFLFGLNLLLIFARKPSAMLSFISIVGSFKYGIWTLYVLFLTNNLIALPDFLIGHILLIVETVVLYKAFTFRLKHFLVAIAWFLLNDFLDYFLGTHPYFPLESFNEVLALAVILSIALPFLLSIVFSRK